MSHEFENCLSDDEILENGLLRRLNVSGSVMNYVKGIHGEYSDSIHNSGYSRIDVLAMIGSLFEEERPGLGLDPRMPNQTAFMLGSYTGLDGLTIIAQAKAMDSRYVLDTWMGSASFFGYENLEFKDKTDETKFAEIAKIVSNQRLNQLAPELRRALTNFTSIASDEGVIAPEQVPVVNQGFAFVIGGWKPVIELMELDTNSQSELSDEELAQWLAS